MTAVPLHLDAPGSHVPDIPFTVAGWIASNSPHPVIGVIVNGHPVPHTLVDRPDVRAVLPAFLTVSGVVALVHASGGRGEDGVEVVLRCDEEVLVHVCHLEGPRTVWESEDQVALRARARAWCLERLCCPTCGSTGRGQLYRGRDAAECRSCGTVYPQQTVALNMISAETGLWAGIVPTANVSSNPYTPDALALIEATTSVGGWVLDCGAGSRPQRLPGVVNVEVVDYPSTDMLAVGQALPFADGSFDAALSLAVLEHVRDPFACARELARVLRPGGTLLADVPFLQPVHGYPDHYYNMTPAGLRNLFAGLGDIEECRVPLHGHPIFGVQWLLGAYLGALPDEARAQFGAMTVAEAASIRPHEFLAHPAAALMPQEAQQVIGCVNTIRFRKAG